MCECLQDGKQYSSANNILWQTISSRSSFILPPASQKYIWESNIEISDILYNCTILMYTSNSRDPPPPIRINHRSRIFKYTNKILDHTSKISLWRSNQREIIDSCLILDLVHCSGSSFGRRRSRRRRHGEEALGQEEKAVERISLYV